MKNWIDITAQRHQSKTPRAKSPESSGLDYRPPALSADFILRFVAGIMVMLGLRLEKRSARTTHLLRTSANIADLQHQMNNRNGLRTMIDAWAEGPCVSVRVQSRKLWLSSKAINNNPDPNIRKMGHDAWATKRPYPRVPGLEPGSPSNLAESLGEIPDICFANSGNTGAALGSKIVIAPP